MLIWTNKSDGKFHYPNCRLLSTLRLPSGRNLGPIMAPRWHEIVGHRFPQTCQHRTFPLRSVLFRSVRKKVDLFLSTFLTCLFSTWFNFDKFDTNPFIYIVQKEHQTIKINTQRNRTIQFCLVLNTVQLTVSTEYVHQIQVFFFTESYGKNKLFFIIFQIIIKNV